MLLHPHSSKPAPLAGAGALSAKHTTAHVARTPIPEGGVNGKGQKKITDPKTGRVRFINMKEGKVQSPTGVPVKPQSFGNQED